MPARTNELVNIRFEAIRWIKARYPHLKRSELPDCPDGIPELQGSLVELETVYALHESELRWTGYLAKFAVAKGDLEVIQWLHKARPQSVETTVIELAAEFGHKEMVEWLCSHGVVSREPLIDVAATSGNLVLVQWLHENGYHGTVHAMARAAGRGHFEVVKWLHENRLEGCTSDAMDAAATSGHLEMLIWLHEHRAERCTAYAFVNTSDWEVLQWLVAAYPDIRSAPVELSLSQRYRQMRILGLPVARDTIRA